MVSTKMIKYESRCGITFDVTPSLKENIEKLIKEVRSEIAKQKKSGRFIAYLSIPISPRGGGDLDTNVAMSKHITQEVESLFGDKLWVLNPACYTLPEGATGGDYMAAWADVLAGDNGRGDDFDIIYFVGPHDVWSFFGANKTNKLGLIENWLIEQAKAKKYYSDILSDSAAKREFLRFYGLRGSVVYSKGAHDEWNIISTLNKQLPVGKDIVVYFDGNPIEPGDYGDLTERGYQTDISW